MPKTETNQFDPNEPQFAESTIALPLPEDPKETNRKLDAASEDAFNRRDAETGDVLPAKLGDVAPYDWEKEGRSFVEQHAGKLAMADRADERRFVEEFRADAAKRPQVKDTHAA